MIRDVILIVSYPNALETAATESVENSVFAGARKLDLILSELHRLQKHPLVVIGPSGDELLLQSRRLHDEDLVFDASEQPDFWSGLWAGIQGCAGACFVLRGEDPIPAPIIWDELEASAKDEFWGQEPQVIRYTRENEKMFPWLLSRGLIQKCLRDPLTNPTTLTETIQHLT